MERVKREENERHDGKRGRGGREREILHRPLLPPGGDSNRAEGGERNEWLNEAVEDAPIVTVIQLLEYAL